MLKIGDSLIYHTEKLRIYERFFPLKIMMYL